MPAIRSLVFKRRALLTFSIAYNGEIMSPCSYCLKKGLVCVIIADPSSCQPFSCSKYTKLNTYVLYNVRLVSLNKCIFFIYFSSL